MSDDTKDLRHLDPKWQGFRILNGLPWTPNGYIPIKEQQIA